MLETVASSFFLISGVIKTNNAVLQCGANKLINKNRKVAWLKLTFFRASKFLVWTSTDTNVLNHRPLRQTLAKIVVLILRQ